MGIGQCVCHMLRNDMVDSMEFKGKVKGKERKIEILVRLQDFSETVP